MVWDGLRFVGECLRWFARTAPAQLALTLAAAVALAGLCWWLCTHYTRLWNLRYHVTWTHHVLCAVAAAATLVFTVVYVSLEQAKPVAQAKIDAWHKAIRADGAFSQRVYRQAYGDAQAAGLETFDPKKHFPPGHPGSLMPLNHEQTRIHTSKLYADAACANFRQQHPMLARILWPGATIPLSVVHADMRDWFAHNPGGTYQLNRGIDLAAAQIRKGLASNTQRVVSLARGYTLLLFVLIQALPFILIGYAAYRDLKEVT